MKELVFVFVVLILLSLIVGGIYLGQVYPLPVIVFCTAVVIWSLIPITNKEK